MPTLRELTESPAAQFSLLRFASQRRISSPLSLRAVLAQYGPLWGFADLHAHPATFLAFGSDVNGNNGPIWGKPGGMHNDATLAVDLLRDLPPCDANKHCGFDEDPVRNEVRKRVVGELEKDAALEHGHSGDGCPSFSYWPSASSLAHQQMHVSAIHRAWRGGLRLLVASAMDNQVLSVLWNRSLMAQWPEVNGRFDFDSAKRQLAFIKALAAANSSWMQVVYSSQEAADTVRQGKLAVILGLEMDGLTTGQIKELVRQDGVRLVTPIHLVDNAFGGAAVYEDRFNTANWFLNDGEFFKVQLDQEISFRFSLQQQFLEYNPTGALEPKNTPFLVYPPPSTSPPLGHRNQHGLTVDNPMQPKQDNLLELMCEGVLLDVTHMSQNSREDALKVAEDPKYRYPLMASHTGLRPTDAAGQEIAGNHENEVKKDHAQRIANLGGMLGLGTGYNAGTASSPVQRWAEHYRYAVGVFNGRPVALGTDMNGLNGQIAKTSLLGNVTQFAIPWPEIGGDPAHANTFDDNYQPGLPSGPNVFYQKGLSHYGMLPEFVYAATKVVACDEKSSALFRSADAFVTMWDRVEQAATSLRDVKYPALKILVHVQGVGDQIFHENTRAGLRGQGRQIEGFQIDFNPAVPNLGMQYSAHVQDVGDMPFVPAGQYIGTRGQGKRLEGFSIMLTGSEASKYEVIYKARLQDYGDTVFCRNGEFCGTKGQARAVGAILVRIKPR